MKFKTEFRGLEFSKWLQLDFLRKKKTVAIKIH